MRKIANSSSIKVQRKPKRKSTLDRKVCLDTAGEARKVVEFKNAEVVYSQGDSATSIMYLESGRIKRSVVNEVGKEAVVAILEPGEFFGEGCLAGQSVRMGTATAITSSAVLDIEKGEMFKVLHEQHAFSDRFLTFMLARNIRIDEDLIDQLFNSSEKRLARSLLLLARYIQESHPQRLLPNVSQHTRAGLFGTTRPPIHFFMDQIMEIRFIKDNGGVSHYKIHLFPRPPQTSTPFSQFRTLSLVDHTSLI